MQDCHFIKNDSRNSVLRFGRCRKLMIATLMATTAFSFISSDWLFSAAHAQSPNASKTNFNIRAQSLSQALVQFSSTTGIQLFFNASLVRGLNSPGAHGQLNSSEALGLLLAGSGLTYRFTNGTTVTIERPGTAVDQRGVNIEGAIPLDTIDVSGGRASASLQNQPFVTPGSSAFISQEQINRVPPVSTGDMFKDAPGVLSAGNRNGASVDVNIRGLQGMNRVNVMVDGTQQSTSTYRGYGGHDSRTYVDPELIGGISIEKGPSGGPYGAGAMGGVVNMRTIEARDVVKNGQPIGARLRGSWGSNSLPVPAPMTAIPRTENTEILGGENFIGSFAGGLVTENIDIVAAFAARKNGNYVAGNHGATTVRFDNRTERLSPYGYGQEVFNTSNDVASTLVKGTVRFLDGHSLELGYIKYKSRFGEIGPTTTQFWLRQQEKLAETETDTYTSKYRYKPGSDWIDFRANVWKADTASNLPASNLWHDTKSRNWGTEIWNDAKTDTPIGAFKLRTGFSYADEFSSSVQQTVGYVLEGFEGNRRISSGFAEADWDVTDWLGLSTSYRYDAFQLEGPINNVTRVPIPGGLFSSTFTQIGTKEAEGHRWNPSYAVKLTPWEGVQFFGKYSEGFRPPSVRETFLGLGNANGIDILPNPNLKPEVAKNYEYGVNVLQKGLLADKDSLKIKVAYFDNNYDNFIVRMNGALVGVPATDTWGNINSAHFKGYETTLHYDVGYLFTDLTTNYYTDITYCYPQTRLAALPSGCMSKTYGRDYGQDYVPPQYMVRLTAGLRLFDEKLTIGGRMTSFGERTISAAAGGSTISPTLWAATKVYDIFGEYKVTDDIAMNFSIENVLDTYYVDPLGVGRNPSPGLTARVGATAKF